MVMNVLRFSLYLVTLILVSPAGSTAEEDPFLKELQQLQDKVANRQEQYTSRIIDTPEAGAMQVCNASKTRYRASAIFKGADGSAKRRSATEIPFGKCLVLNDDPQGFSGAIRLEHIKDGAWHAIEYDTIFQERHKTAKAKSRTICVEKDDPSKPTRCKEGTYSLGLHNFAFSYGRGDYGVILMDKTSIRLMTDDFQTQALFNQPARSREGFTGSLFDTSRNKASTAKSQQNPAPSKTANENRTYTVMGETFSAAPQKTTQQTTQQKKKATNQPQARQSSYKGGVIIDIADKHNHSYSRVVKMDPAEAREHPDRIKVIKEFKGRTTETGWRIDYAKPDKDEHGEWERARLLVCNFSGQDMRLRTASGKKKAYKPDTIFYFNYVDVYKHGECGHIPGVYGGERTIELRKNGRWYSPRFAADNVEIFRNIKAIYKEYCFAGLPSICGAIDGRERYHANLYLTAGHIRPVAIRIYKNRIVFSDHVQ